MHVSIASFIPCIYCCLDYFRYKCLFVTSADVYKNEIITRMYCWLVFCCHFFQFSTLAIACLFAFGNTPAGVFLERAIHAFIRFHFSNRVLICVLFRRACFRTNHTCIYLFPTQFSHRVARLYAFIVSARVFLERAIHAFFPFLFNFSNRYFGSHHVFKQEPYLRSSVPFPTFPTAILYTFTISARVLNESYGLTWPGTSLRDAVSPLERVERIGWATNFLMRYSFTT